MIRFNFLLALRSMMKNQVTAFINLFGLSVAFTALLLILLYLINETGYDRYNKNSDRIFRITRSGIDVNGKTEAPGAHVNFAMAHHMKNDFPQDVEKIVRFSDYSNELISSESNKKSFVESRLFCADPGVFDIFSWELVKGNPSSVLKDLNTIVISESTAKRYFDGEEPIGKVLTMNNTEPLTVVGVFADVPDNSHFKPDMLISMSTREKLEGYDDLMNDQSNNDATYVLLSPGADVNSLTAQLPLALDKYYPLLSDGRKSSQGYSYQFWPIKDLHLYFEMDSSTEANGNYVMVYIFAVTALLILLIACINFINLSTARLSQRAKEVGLKKSIGALRITLFGQFIAEAFLSALLSLILAIGIAYLVLPMFNSFVGKSLTLSALLHFKESMMVLLLLLVVSIVAGGYPGYYLSSFKASDVLKRGVTSSWRKFSVRSVLVGFQFLLALLLIISVLIVRQQLDFVNSFDVGFNRNNLIVLPASTEIFKNFKSVKAQLEQQPGIERVTLASRVPSGRLSDAQDPSIEVNGRMQPLSLRIADVHVDHDFFKVLGLPLAAGRDFDYNLASDSMQAFILNETAVKEIGWKSNEEAIGKTFHYGSVRKGTVVGVVKDFNFESLHETIKPTVFVVVKGRMRTVVLRIDEKKKEDVLKYLAEQWSYWRPGFPFTYYSLSDNFERQYEKEKRISEGINFFAALAIFVSSLGVFGLALFMAEQRAKEVSIRKALGAGTHHIMMLLSKWFLALIALALIIAVPVSYLLLSSWLKTFAFATEVSYQPFLVALAIVLLCTAVSVIIQLIRAAVQNPVKALRCE